MDLFQSRRFVIQAAFIFVIVIYSLRLLYLQLIDSSHKQLANSNSLRRETVFPARGLIYDRNKKLILYNKAEYDVMVTPSQTKAFDTLEFCKLLDMAREDFVSTLRKAYKSSPYRSSVIRKGVQPDQFVPIREALYQFPGFFYQVRTVRYYPFPAAAHVLGYIGEVSPKQIDRSGGYYKQGDYIGTTGVEEYYEKVLRGTKGVRFTLVDVNNRTLGSFADAKFDTLAVPGKNLLSSVNIDLQEYGERLMKNKIGSIVAIEPATGEILAMISSPGYDPGLLSGKDRGKHFKDLYADSLKPLFNRAIKAPYPPGSTFKPVMAAIGMEEGTINPWASFSQCHGGIYIGSMHIGCHVHGPIANVCQAIAVSCNGYFANYFRATVDNSKKYNNIAEALHAWHTYVNNFGLGVKTGIDLPGEGYGFAPDSSFYNKRYGKGNWRSSMIVSIGFGQGELSETPLQICNLMCGFANRGYWYSPHLIKEVEGGDSITLPFKQKHFTGLDTAVCRIVIEGMKDVVEEGTATIAKLPGITICGKTGTAQNPHGNDHSLFACFAPKDNPKIAVSVVVENAGFGAAWAAPIASLMIEKYMNDTIANNRKYLEKRMEDGNLIHK